jgi:hypothetical protein
VDSRGASLLDEVDQEPRLVEGHGLTAHRRYRLENEDLDVDRYDAELRGVAVPPDGYGHWTADGWITEHGDELRRELDVLVGDLDERTDLDDADVDESTLSQLEDLGYA